MKTPIIMKNSAREWSAAALGFVGFFSSMWAYHLLRAKPYDLFSANKAIAIAAVMVICLAVVIGPLARLAGRRGHGVRLRRPLALTGVFFVVVHVTISVSGQIPKFDLAYFLDKWVSIALAALATVALLAMAALSFTALLRRLGSERWKAVMGALVPAVLLLTIGHIVGLGKVAGWIEYFRTFPYPVPPGTTVPTFFCLAALVIRLLAPREPATGDVRVVELSGTGGPALAGRNRSTSRPAA